MNKVFVIAAREYLGVVRSKAFVISLVLLPVMMFAPSFLQRATRKVVDVKDRQFVVVDRSEGGEIFGVISRAVEARNQTRIFDPETGKQIEPKFVLERVEPAQGRDATDRQRFELSERARRGEIFGFVEVGADLLNAVPATQPASRLPDDDPRIVRYQTNTPTYLDFRQLVADSVDKHVRSRRLTNAGVSPEKFASLLAVVPVVNKGLARKEADGAITYNPPNSEFAAFLVPFGLVFLMFIVVMIGAIPLTQGIVEEKQNRIAEVLLGSVSPFQLMSGKVLGLVATTMTLIAVYLGGAWYALQKMNYGEYLPGHVIGWFIVFQLLAVLMYGSLYIAIGASCTDSKEVQTLIMPVNLVMVIPIMVIVNVLQNPNGPLARLLTYFPPATPMISVARISVAPGMPGSETVIAVALVVLTTLFFIWASGKIFRIGILMQGKGASMGQLVKWVFSR